MTWNVIRRSGPLAPACSRNSREEPSRKSSACSFPKTDTNTKIAGVATGARRFTRHKLESFELSTDRTTLSQLQTLFTPPRILPYRRAATFQPSLTAGRVICVHLCSSAAERGPLPRPPAHKQISRRLSLRPPGHELRKPSTQRHGLANARPAGLIQAYIG